MSIITPSDFDVSRAIAFAVRCGTGQKTNREAVIESKLKSAKGQFSGHCPSIVFLDMRIPVSKPSDLDMQPAKEITDNWLRQNLSVSAVFLTTDFSIKEGGGATRARCRVLCQNKQARMPLKADFTL